MKILAGVTILAAILQPCVVWAIEPAYYKCTLKCVCPLIYQPVCGSDGNTYSNECFLKCASAHNVANDLPPIHVCREGECPREPCICPAVYDPVCGNNNQTFGNECVLKCENKWRKKYGFPLIKLKHKGECGDFVCTCENDILPVCGTDGKTYRNVCILGCYSNWNINQGLPPIKVASKGACKEEGCACPKIYDPQCASDGATYANPCILKCHNRRLGQLGMPPLTVEYKGECIVCQCPYNYDPVCASDRNTYSNLCLLECENKKRKAKKQPPLEVLFKGECGCGCDKRYDPVCATDKRTYNNRCLLRCENRIREILCLPPLTVKYSGRCTCDCNHCSSVKDPVCGLNGKKYDTYLNMCWLKCYSRCNVNAGYPPIKLIKDGPC